MTIEIEEKIKDLIIFYQSLTVNQLTELLLLKKAKMRQTRLYEEKDRTEKHIIAIMRCISQKK